VDDRFFPKDLADALAGLDSPDPEDSFAGGLQALARLRGKQGGPEALREQAFAPLLEKGLGTRLEHVVSFAGEVLASLDRRRLVEEVSRRIEKESEGRRMRNAAVLLEEAGGAEAVAPLLRIAAKCPAPVRTRVCEALGVVCDARRGVPRKDAQPAVAALVAHHGAAGKDTELKNVCAVALGKIGDPKALPALLAGLGETNGEHGFFAALALGWIEDPAVFPAVVAASPGGGESLEAQAKAVEACARPAHAESLVAMFANSGKSEFREAAAIALGRLLQDAPPPPPEGSPEGRPAGDPARAALRLDASRALFERMVSDQDRNVQAACFHAVSRVGGPWLGEDARHLLQSPKEATVERGLHLCGDWKVAAAATTLLRGIFGVKEDLMRKRCAIEFWRIGDGAAVEEFERRLKALAADGGEGFARGCDALGSRRTPEGFALAVDLLKRAAPRDQFQVELALEKMTGHFFGANAGSWEKWFEKNPRFFTARQQHIEREKWREEFDRENRGFRQTKETEKSVQMGLEYLARHQAADGAWDANHFKDCCDQSPPCATSYGARVQEDPVSRTALSVLAFAGAGYVPGQGKYKCSMRRGLEYLMARQQVHGDYQTNDLIGGYNRPLCLQAYAEALALTGDERFRPFVQKGVDFLTQIQNRIGGWRYRVDVETSDSSVGAWMLFAMKAAEKSGVPVREVVFEGCRMLFDRYGQRVVKEREDWVDVDPAYGFEVGRDAKYEYHTGYQDQAQAPNKATTALGLMSRILLGYRRSHPFCIGSANYLLRVQLPEIPKEGDLGKLNIGQEYPMYFLYYGTLAMHQMGGRFFRTWNDRLRVILPGTQVTSGCARGSWVPKNFDGFFGSLYGTAMGVLALETYYRYAPILQD